MDQNPQKTRVDNFFRSEYQKLVNFVRKNFDDRFFGATPEDIVQDVALGLIDRLDLDTQVGNLSAYIYRSIKNRITDSRKKVQRNVSLESFADQGKGNYLLNTISNETDEETVYSDIDPEMLREAIAQLRPDEQAVIIATEFEQRSYEELSDEWDIPIGTLLSRKHRALSKLHRILLNKNNINHGNNRK
ncbi:MAG: sigma-70 family RNA polymerase sigma factor [Bacteroidota bacterium]